MNEPKPSLASEDNLPKLPTPLTEEEIAALFNKVIKERHAYPERRFRDFARYVERAHGITGPELFGEEKQLTHAEGCWSWGPTHYQCACAEIAKLNGWKK